MHITLDGWHYGPAPLGTPLCIWVGTMGRCICVFLQTIAVGPAHTLVTPVQGRYLPGYWLAGLKSINCTKYLRSIRVPVPIKQWNKKGSKYSHLLPHVCQNYYSDRYPADLFTIMHFEAFRAYG